MNFIDHLKKDIEISGDCKVVNREGRTDAELREHRKSVIAGHADAPTVREICQPIIDISERAK